MKKSLVTAALFLSFATSASAVPITSGAFFTMSDTTIDFESINTTTVVPLSDEFAALGVEFSSESTPGSSQATDFADATNRFDETMRVFDQSLFIGSGYIPATSGTMFAGPFDFGTLGQHQSDLRFDFNVGVLAFGMQVLDNDFSVGRLQAFDAMGTLLDTVVIPQVPDAAAAYHGIDVTGTGSQIAYAILDGNNGNVLDSTLIDDFSFRVAPSSIPLPAGGMMLLLGLGGLFSVKRRGKITD